MLLLVGLGLSSHGFGAAGVGAAPSLAFQGACQPDPVRPNVAVLLTCTTSLANNGDQAATGLTVNIGPASDCAIPSSFTFIDRTVNGQLVALGSSELSFSIPDLPAGQTGTAVTRLIATSGAVGRTGGAITISSRDDPAVTAGGDICWNVATEASAPSTNLRVTNTRLTEPVASPPAPAATPQVVTPAEPISPPPLASPTVPASPQPSTATPASQARFEIVISNAGSQPMTDVTLLGVLLGNATLTSAAPAASATDSLGRPTWRLGALASGAEARVVLTFGAPANAACAFADELAIVTGTPAGGAPEYYPASSTGGAELGTCSQGQGGPGPIAVLRTGFGLPNTGVAAGAAPVRPWTWLAVLLATALALSSVAFWLRQHRR